MNTLSIYNAHRHWRKRLLAVGLIRFIVRQFYKNHYYDSRGDDALYGKFRVKYPDNKLSQKMCWHSAQQYSQIFKGKIVDAF